VLDDHKLIREIIEKQVEVRIKAEFDLLDSFSSAYCDKQQYFMQDSGMVYSRYSARYMTLSDAIDEFIEILR